MTEVKNWLMLPSVVYEKLAISILVPVASGFIVGLTGRSVKVFYQKLRRPPLSPPGYVFAPVWGCLYTLMGYASHRAWQNGFNSLYPDITSLAIEGAMIYTVQLALNLAFQPLFFQLKRPVLATVDILAVTSLATYLTYTWYQIDTIAALCLIPYLAWLYFASYLAIGTGYLNNWNFRSPSLSADKSI